MTEQLYLTDAHQTGCDATVVEVRRAAGGSKSDEVRLDRTVMYATGGGQPHDTGTIAGRAVTAVFHDPEQHDEIWHVLSEGEEAPAIGQAVRVELDRERRYSLMRTHTAMHILGGVMFRDHGVVVTGGNMEPLGGRLDFEFPDPPDGFREQLEAAINAEITADRPITVSFLPREQALADDSLIRTKVSLVPDSVSTVRVVDIEGLDRQADGGTHVSRTCEVGGLRVAKVQSKGRGFRRVRLEVLDAPPG